TAWRVMTAAPRTSACSPARILSAAPASRCGRWNSFFVPFIDGSEALQVNDDIRREEELADAPETEVSQAAPETPEEAEKDAGKAEKPKKSVGREIREWVVALAAAVLIALLIRTFLFTLIRVDGDSMYDTLHNDERL